MKPLLRVLMLPFIIFVMIVEGFVDLVGSVCSELADAANWWRE